MDKDPHEPVTCEWTNCLDREDAFWVGKPAPDPARCEAQATHLGCGGRTCERHACRCAVSIEERRKQERFLARSMFSDAVYDVMISVRFLCIESMKLVKAYIRGDKTQT